MSAAGPGGKGPAADCEPGGEGRGGRGVARWMAALRHRPRRWRQCHVAGDAGGKQVFLKPETSGRNGHNHIAAMGLRSLLRLSAEKVDQRAKLDGHVTSARIEQDEVVPL